MAYVRYRIHCSTESADKFWVLDESDPVPTTCPTDTAHTITGDAVNIGTIGPADVTLAGVPTTSDLKPIFQPAVFPGDRVPYYTGAADDYDAGTRGDGFFFHVDPVLRQAVTISGATTNGDVQYRAVAGGASSVQVAHVIGATGAGNENRALACAASGNDVTVTFGTDGAGASVTPTATDTAAAVAADGPSANLVTATAQGTGADTVGTQALTGLADVDDKFTYDFGWIDHIYAFGGRGEASDAGLNDWMSMELVAPATPVVSNPGAGNCNLVDPGVGAAVLIVPAPGVDGNFDVDLAAALNANLSAKSKGTPTKVTQAVPVPAVDANDQGIGYYDMDDTTGAITASTVGGTGRWNLWAIELTMIRWVNRLPIYAPASSVYHLETTVPVKSKKIYPHWRWRLHVCVTDSSKTPHVSFFVLAGRRLEETL